MSTLARRSTLRRSTTWSVIVATLAVLLAATVLVIAAPTTAAAQDAANPLGPVPAEGTVTCYAVADGTSFGSLDSDSPDRLVRITDALGTPAVEVVGIIPGTVDVEALAVRPNVGLVAWDSALGAIQVNATDASVTPSSLAITGADIDGLAFDTFGLEAFAVERVEGASDVVSWYDAVSGALVSSRTIDVSAITTQNDIDGIAFDPATAFIYAIAGSNVDNALIRIDYFSGVATEVGPLVNDVEGLGFTLDGQLVGTTGFENGSDLYLIDKATGAAALQSTLDLPDAVDFESIDCLDLSEGPLLRFADMPIVACDGISETTADVSFGLVDESRTSPTTPFTVQFVEAGVVVTEVSGSVFGSGTDGTTVPNGSYTLNLIVGGEVIDTATAVANCIEPTGPTFDFAIECVNNDGLVTFELTGASPGGNEFVITVGGASKTVVADAGVTVTEVIGSRPDGDTFVTVQTPAAGGQPAGTTTVGVTIACDAAPADLAVTVAPECRTAARPGAIATTVTNNGASAGVYSIDVIETTAAPFTGTLQPGESATRVRTGRVDGVYTVVTSLDGTVVDTQSVTIDCVADFDPSASIAIQCVGADGDIMIDLNAGSPDASTFTITVTTNIEVGSQSITVPAGTTRPVLIVDQPDGTYTVRVNSGGAVLATTTETIACDPPPAVVDVLVTPLCVSNDGQILINLINRGGSPADYSVDVLELVGVAPFTGTLAIDDAATLRRTGRSDGIYTIVTSIGGVVVDTQTVTIDCVVEAPPLATIASYCVNNDGVIAATVTGGRPDGSTLTLVVPGLSDRSVTLGAGETDVLRRTGRRDGNYLVQVLDGETVVTEQTVTIACDPNPAAVQVQAATTCVNGAGVITTTITNFGATSSFYSVDITEIPNHQPFAGTLAPGQSTELVRTGRADGTYTIVTMADGLINSAPLTVTVDCVNEAAPTATITNFCFADNGVVEFVINGGNPDVIEAVASLTGLADRVVTVPPNETVVTRRTGRPDNSYVATVTVGDVVIASQEITVACDPDPAVLMVMPSVACAENGLGVIDITVLNKGASAGLYSIDILEIPDHAPFVGTLVPGDSRVLSRTSRPDGTYTIVSSLDGDVVSTQTVVVDCFDEMVPTASITSVCVNNDGVIEFTLNGGTSTYDLTTTVTGLDDRVVTVPAGATIVSKRFGRPDGVYTASVFAGDMMIATTTTLVVACDPPPAFVSVGISTACVDGAGRVFTTLTNSGGSAASYSVMVADNPDNGTLAAGDSVVETTSGRPDGPITVTVTVDGAVVLVEAVDIDCVDEGIATSTVAGVCVGTAGTTGGIAINLALAGGDFPVDFFVQIPDLSDTRTVTVDPSSSEQLAIGPIGDGTYMVTINDVTTSVTVDCVEELEGAARINRYDCVNDSSIIVMEHVAGAAPIEFELMVNDTTFDPVEVAPGETIRRELGGLKANPGRYTVLVKVDGQIVRSRVLNSTCLFGSAQVICRADGGGLIEFTLENQSSVAATYTLQVQGLSDQDRVVASDTTAIARRTNVRVDGDYAVALLAEGVTVFSETLTIDCPSPANAIVRPVCRSDAGGLIEFTLENGATTPIAYTLRVDALADQTRVVPAGTTEVALRTNARANGTYQVVVLAAGLVIFEGPITLDCPGG